MIVYSHVVLISVGKYSHILTLLQYVQQDLLTQVLKSIQEQSFVSLKVCWIQIASLIENAVSIIC